MEDFDFYVDASILEQIYNSSGEVYIETPLEKIIFKITCREDYRRYLLTPHWKKRRLKAIMRAGQRCEYLIDGARCFCTHPLQVHHLTYVNIWEEKDEDLQVLCRSHHVVVELLKVRCVGCEHAVFTTRDAETFVAYYGFDVTQLRQMMHTRCSECRDPARQAVKRIKLKQEYELHGKADLAKMVERLKAGH